MRAPVLPPSRGFASEGRGNTDRMSSRTDDRHRVEQDVASRPVKAGKDGRTLVIALGGTVLVIAVVFAIALCLVVAAYLLAR